MSLRSSSADFSLHAPLVGDQVWMASEAYTPLDNHDEQQMVRRPLWSFRRSAKPIHVSQYIGYEHGRQIDETTVYEGTHDFTTVHRYRTIFVRSKCGHKFRIRNSLFWYSYSLNSTIKRHSSCQCPTRFPNHRGASFSTNRFLKTQ